MSTTDRRNNKLIFKVNLVEMESRVLLDFRLSKVSGGRARVCKVVQAGCRWLQSGYKSVQSVCKGVQGGCQVVRSGFKTVQGAARLCQDDARLVQSACTVVTRSVQGGCKGV